MKEKIKAYAKSLQIEYIGITSAEPMPELKAHLEEKRKVYGITSFEEPDLDRRTCPKLTLSGAKSIIVCLFPYYSGTQKDCNISKYACIADYHIVAKERLEKISAFIKTQCPDANTVCYADNGPLVDKYLAYQAGLGFYGKNTLLINEKYGSYVFIGYIITNLSLAPDAPLAKRCQKCGRCIKACPGNALSTDCGLHPEQCVSYITQQKNITEKQKQILLHQPFVYGCDACQDVCPHNQNVPETPIDEFKKIKLPKLSYDALSSMSNREFLSAYKHFPFAWRGKGAILKNFLKFYQSLP